MENKELLDIVDEKDNIIGRDTKENKFRKELISRSVSVFVLDNDKKIIITKRSPKKISFPNRYDLAVCGNLKAGEKYEEGAKREMMEELGIESNIKFLKKIFNEFEEWNLKIKYFTGIFLCYFSGKMQLSDELVGVKKLTLGEIEDLIKKDKNLFTPGFISDFISVKDQLK